MLLGACSTSSARSAGAARPRGVVAVTVVDSTTESVGRPASSSPGARARASSRAGGAFRVALEPLDGPVPVGTVRWLEAIVTDSLGRPVADAAVLWASSDSGVVSVSRVGRALAPVTGRRDGRATVTASVGAASASVEVLAGRAAQAAAATASTTFGAGAGAAQVLVEPRRLDARVGDRVTLRAIAIGARGDTLRACPLRWSTSGAPAAPAGGAAPGGATAVYRVLAAGPVMVTAACEGVRGVAVVVVR